MAFTVHVYPEHRLVHVRLAGSVDGEQLVGATHAVVGHPAWRPGYRSVCDASAVSELCLAPTDLQRYLDTRRMYRAAGRAGGAHLIVVRRSLDAAIARLVAHKAEALGARDTVVGSFEEALGVLGIAPPRDLAA